MLEVPVPFDRRDSVVALGLILLVLLTGSVRIAPGVCGVYHDDAIYVSTAQALANGEGYRLTGVPGAPLQTKYPILYPAALATICSLSPSFPDNLLAMKVVTLLCGAGTVALVYLYVVRFRYCGRFVAAAGGVLCATAPSYLYFCVQTMAAMPFALLTVCALWAQDSYLSRPALPRRRQQLGLGALIALPFLCRVIGAVFVVSGIAVLWRSRRPVIWSLLGATAVALPWVLWSLLGRGIWDRSPIQGYYTDYVGCWSSTGLQMLGEVVRSNAVMVAIGTGRLTCEGLAFALKPFCSHEARLTLLMMVGVVPWLMMLPALRQMRPLAWALAAYLMLVLVWSWPPQRFLVPILPFLTTYLLAALAALVTRLAPAFVGRLAVVAVIAALVAANLGLLAHHGKITDRSGYPLIKAADSRVQWSSFQRTFAWLRRNSQPDDVVACGLDSMVSLYTGRKAFRPFVYNPDRLFYGNGQPQLMTVEELASILKRSRPRYLVHTPMPGFAEERLFTAVVDELRRTYPGWLTVVYQDADPRFVVFELDFGEQQFQNPPNEPDASACRLIRSAAPALAPVLKLLRAAG